MLYSLAAIGQLPAALNIALAALPDAYREMLETIAVLPSGSINSYLSTYIALKLLF